MREKYESLALVDLKEIAKARGIKGTSTMKKAAIVEAMLAEDEKDKAAGKEVTVKSVVPAQDNAGAQSSGGTHRGTGAQSSSTPHGAGLQNGGSTQHGAGAQNGAQSAPAKRKAAKTHKPDKIDKPGPEP